MGDTNEKIKKILEKDFKDSIQVDAIDNAIKKRVKSIEDTNELKEAVIKFINKNRSKIPIIENKKVETLVGNISKVTEELKSSPIVTGLLCNNKINEIIDRKV